MAPRTVLRQGAPLGGQSKWKLSLLYALEVVHLPYDIEFEVTSDPEYEDESNTPFLPGIAEDEPSLEHYISDWVSTVRSPIFPLHEICHDNEETMVMKFARNQMRSRPSTNRWIHSLPPLMALFKSLIIKTQPLSDEAAAQVHQRIWQEKISADEVAQLKALLGVSEDTHLMAYLSSAGDIQFLSKGDTRTSSPPSTGGSESAPHEEQTALIYVDGEKTKIVELWQLALRPQEVVEHLGPGGAFKKFHYYRKRIRNEKPPKTAITRVWDDEQRAARLVPMKPQGIDELDERFLSSAEKCLFLEVKKLLTELAYRGHQKGLRQCQEAVREQKRLQQMFTDRIYKRLGMRRNELQQDLNHLRSKLTTLLMRCDLLARTSWLTSTQREQLLEVVARDRNDWRKLRNLYEALGIERQSALTMVTVPTGALQRFSSHNDMSSTTLIVYDGYGAIAVAISLDMSPVKVEAQLRDPKSQLSEYLEWRFGFKSQHVTLVRDWSDDSKRTFLTFTTTDKRLPARKKRLLARLERLRWGIRNEKSATGDVFYPRHLQELASFLEPRYKETSALFDKIHRTSGEVNLSRFMREAKKLKGQYEDFTSKRLLLQRTSVLTHAQLEHVLPYSEPRPFSGSELHRALRIPSGTPIILIDVVDGTHRTLPGTSRSSSAVILADKESGKTYMVRLEVDPPTFFEKMCSEVDFLPKFFKWRFGLENLEPSTGTSAAEVKDGFAAEEVPSSGPSNSPME